MEKLIVQRGWKRTCTNYSRVIIEKNFRAKVITSNKHERYEGYDILLDRICGLCAPWPHESFEPYFDESKSGHPHSIPSSDIRKASSNNMLYHIICIKNPIKWLLGTTDATSFIKNVTSHEGTKIDPGDINQIMKIYNNRYNAWASLIDSSWETTFIVRHEDLLCNFSDTLDRLANKFGLEKVNHGIAGYYNEELIVEPQSRGKITIGRSPYPAEYAKNDWIDAMYKLDYTGMLHARKATEAIKNNIDFDMLEKYYGYSKKDCLELLGMIESIANRE